MRPNIFRLLVGTIVTTLFLSANLYLLLFAEENVSAVKPSTSTSSSGPIQLKLETTQNIYSSHQGVMLKVELLAKERAKLCLAKDLMSQMQFKVAKSGVNMPLKPMIVKDNSKVYQQTTYSRWLEPGEKVTYHINLKRLKFNDGTPWLPGEYSASATYMLCPQVEDKRQSEFSQSEGETDDMKDDIPIKTNKPIWFMIMS